MTVKELIDELNKVEDKSKEVIYKDGNYPMSVDTIFEGENEIELI